MLKITRGIIDPKTLYWNAESLEYSYSITDLLRKNDITYLNFDSILTYLLFRFTLFDDTIFRDIYKLPPGHTLLQSGQIKSSKLIISNKIQDRNVLLRRIRQILDDFGDNISEPIYISASGGLDSTIALALLQQKSIPATLASVGFRDVNEFKWVRKVKDYFHCDSEEFIITDEEYLNYLEELPNIIPEPIGGLDIARYSYLIFRIKEKGAKTVVGGIAADELFNGYGRWIKFTNKSEFSNQYITQNSLSSFVTLKRCASVDEEYIKNYVKSKLFKIEDVLNQTNDPQTKNRITNIYFRLPSYESLFTVSIPLYYRMDYKSPYLSNDLVDVVFNSKETYFSVNGLEKAILRDSVKDLLPQDILYRKKEDFTGNLGLWISNVFISKVLNAVRHGHISQLSIFDPKKVEKLLLEKDKNVNNFFLRILTLEYYLLHASKYTNISYKY